MVLTILMYVGFALLVLKALWNLAAPFRLVLRPYDSMTGATEPIRFEMIVDVLLLCWTLVLIPFSTDDWLFCSRPLMAVIAVALPVGSLVHFLIVGFLLGWAKATFTRKGPTD